MKSTLLILLFCLVSCSIRINASNILYISLTPSPSHHIWDKTLATGLKDRGHNIVFVSHSPGESTENFTIITFEDVYEKMQILTACQDFHGKTNIGSIIGTYDWILAIAGFDLETKGFKQLMDLVNKNPKFDLIIMETTSGEYIYPIFEKLGNPPIIGTSPYGIQPYHSYHTGMDIQPSYIPLNLLPFTNKMNFWQRAQNLFYTSFFILYRQYVYMPKLWKRVEEFYGKDVKHYREYEKQFSLLLANTDSVLDYPTSLPPEIVLVGGLHTVRNSTIPKDLQKVLDNATNGVVLFSLGTNVLSKHLQPDQKQALIDGLGQLKQTVLWKYEENITGLPENFITRMWYPQNAILAHPNVKAFLTHGGALSTNEAMLYGVPVISMPFFADQIVNTNKMVDRKLGKSLKYGKLTADIVYETVNDVLYNEEYSTNMKLISKRFLDQKEDPLTRAIWWTEYTIRNGGTGHLAVGSKNMPNYQLYMLDVWAVIFITILLIYYVTKKIISMFCNSKSSQVHKKVKIH